MWPGSIGFSSMRRLRLADGDVANASSIEMDVHVGTHVDAPLHFLEDGRSVEALPLEALLGRAHVLDLTGLRSITAPDLERAGAGEGGERLLLKTSNSFLWSGPPRFTEGYVGLTLDAAEWLVGRSPRLIGIDYLSVQRFQDDARTHEVLLRADIVILEGLDLSAVSAGEYELICLPISIEGAEAAPARAVLRPLPSDGRLSNR